VQPILLISDEEKVPTALHTYRGNPFPGHDGITGIMPATESNLHHAGGSTCAVMITALSGRSLISIQQPVSDQPLGSWGPGMAALAGQIQIAARRGERFLQSRVCASTGDGFTCTATAALSALSSLYMTDGPSLIACDQGQNVPQPPGSPGWVYDPTGSVQANPVHAVR
jgi:hypothetical protein